jgi:histidine triad (HIT) family protein
MTEEIPQEQIDQLKENIIKQVQNQEGSQEQKNEFVEKIKSMNNEEFVSFLKQQGIIKDENQPQGEGQKCIFCSIVFGDVPSRKIAENEKAVAVLEINPMTKGHAIIIPKEHTQETIHEVADLAEELKKKIKKELEPKDVKVESTSMFGHQIVNVIPIYEDTPKQPEKKQASEEELNELEEKLNLLKTEPKEAQKSEEESKEEEEINEENTWLPKRLP